MVDVLLIHSPVSFIASRNEDIIPDCPPLGLLYLASEVNKAGLTCEVIDAIDGSWNLDRLVEYSKQAKIVGITAMTMNIRGAIELAKAIKQRNPYVKLCLGGPHISADNGIINRFPYFDFGITGEADITFPKMAKQIIQNRMNYRGLYNSEVPMELDNFTPARYLVDWKFYKEKRGWWANAIMASRGCPFGCIFCSIPAILRKYRKRNPDKVAQEMLKTYQITNEETFVFIDDIFTLNRDYVIRLCEEIKPLNFKWEAQTRANLVDDELLQTMKKAGCYKLVFGVESGSERIRCKIINKKVTDAEIQEATRLCWKNNIEPDWYLMLGFPTETKEEMLLTVNFPIKTKPNPNIIGVHLTTPLPGASLFDKFSINNQFVIDKYIRGEFGQGYKDCWPYYVPEGMTIEEIKEMRQLAYSKFYFRFSYIVRRLWRDITSLSKLKKDIKQALSLWIFGRSADDK